MTLRELKTLLTAAILSMVLAACGSGQESAEAPTEVSLATLGLNQIALEEAISQGRDASVVSGVQQALAVQLVTTDGQPSTVLLDPNGSVPGVALTKAGTAYSLSVQPAAEQQGKTLSIPLRAYSSDRTKYADVTLRVVVATVLDTASAAFSGGEVSMGARPETTVRVAAPALMAPVTVTTVVSEKPSGEVVFKVSFSRDVASEGVRVSLPQPVTSDPFGILRATDAPKTRLSHSAAPLPEGWLSSISQLVKRASAEARYRFAGGTDNSILMNPRIYENSASTTIGGKGGPFGMGQRLASWQGCFLVLPTTIPRLWPGGVDAKSCDVFIDSLVWYRKSAFELLISKRAASELHTAIVNDGAKGLDWKNYVPVLFVHGYSPQGLGGGAGTWSNFPKLAAATDFPAGARAVPFEFHWDTNANLKQVAAELAAAIAGIKRLSGDQNVHLVAHSFGGVLTRLILQGQSSDTEGAATSVASLTTLGSPHSGTFGDGARWANGRDSSVFGLCVQLSCWQTGVRNFVVEDLFVAENRLDKFGVRGELAGHIIETLHQTREQLPALPIHVGIGLTRNLVGNHIGTGDFLISFAGQRFVPFATRDAANAAPPLKAQTVGKATVTEEILGWASTVRPGDVVSDQEAADLPTLRANGYLHSSTTGLGNLLSTDGGPVRDQGLMAAPTADCDLPITCRHAGYTLFAQMVGNVVSADITAQIALRRGTVLRLVANPTAGMTAGQVTYLQGVLDQLATKGAVGGGRIFWELLNDADAGELNRGLAANFPDTPRVALAKQDYLENQAGLTAFAKRYFSKANRFVVMDKQNAISFLQIGANMFKAGLGSAQVIWPEIGYADVLERDDPIAAAELQNLRAFALAFKSSQPLIEFMSACSGVFLSDWQTAANKVSNGNASAGDVLTFIKEPIGCIASGLDFTDRDRLKWTVALLKSSLDGLDADGKPIKMFSATFSAASVGLQMLKPNPAISRVQGVVDVLSAYVDAVIIGQEMADHTGQVVSVDAANVQELVTRLTAQLLRQRTLRELDARVTGLYVIAPDPLPVVNTIHCTAAQVGNPLTCTVSGTNLPNGLRLSAAGCTGIQELAGGSATQRVFSCTPTVVGVMAVSVLGVSGSESLFTQSLTVALPPATEFVDEFDAASLDTAKWTVASNGGVPATLNLSGGYLNVAVPGGSCGSCGTSDGSTLVPNISPLAADFSVEMSADELSRVSRDGRTALSTIQMVLYAGSNTQVGVYAVGDARNNSGTAGHVIYMYSVSGGVQDIVSSRELTVGQYQSFKFRIRRSAGHIYLAHKLSTETGWTEFLVRQSISTTAAFTPKFIFASGDGGRTSVNSSLGARVDYVRMNLFSGSASMPTGTASLTEDTFIWWGGYVGGRGEVRNFDVEDRLITCGYGWQSSGNGTAKSLLKFDASLVPPTATQVVLNLYKNSSDNNYGATIEAYKALSPWVENQVTWNSWDGLGSYDPSSNYGAISVPQSTAQEWVRIPITRLVKEWQQGVSPNHGVMLDSRNNPASGCRSFNSLRAATNRPYISWE